MGQEHTHETDARQVDGALLAGVLRQRDAELVPLHRLATAIAQGDCGLTDVRDEVLAHLHVLRTDAHLVLQVALILVQRIVLVDVLNVRIGLIRGIIALRLLVAVWRVALWHVDTLVTLQDRSLAIVQIRASEVVVVVVGWVGNPCRAHAVVHNHVVEEVGIGRIAQLLVVRQTVESHVLLGSCTTGRGEGVGLCGLLGNLTPRCPAERSSTVDRHTTLVELLAVAQDILAHLTQVDEQVAAIVGSIALIAGIDEGVQQPELDILDVGSLEVVGVQLTHHSTPALIGVA